MKAKRNLVFSLIIGAIITFNFTTALNIQQIFKGESLQSIFKIAVAEAEDLPPGDYACHEDFRLDSEGVYFHTCKDKCGDDIKGWPRDEETTCYRQ
jgi:hypothetical protein